jgi:small acid-soluble spore protein F (minor alpha/beta-type SASP)
LREGGLTVAKLMSDALKYEIARQLGVEGTVQREGWGSVSSKNCGRIVQQAIEMAENSLKGK